jgi:flagellar motor switch protein FliG
LRRFQHAFGLSRDRRIINTVSKLLADAGLACAAKAHPSALSESVVSNMGSFSVSVMRTRQASAKLSGQ